MARVLHHSLRSESKDALVRRAGRTRGAAVLFSIFGCVSMKSERAGSRNGDSRASKKKRKKRKTALRRERHYWLLGFWATAAHGSLRAHCPTLPGDIFCWRWLSQKIKRRGSGPPPHPSYFFRTLFLRTLRGRSIVCGSKMHPSGCTPPRPPRSHTTRAPRAPIKSSSGRIRIRPLDFGKEVN